VNYIIINDTDAIAEKFRVNKLLHKFKGVGYQIWNLGRSQIWISLNPNELLSDTQELKCREVINKTEGEEDRA
jgi:hypothetical protein